MIRIIGLLFEVLACYIVLAQGSSLVGRRFEPSCCPLSLDIDYGSLFGFNSAAIVNSTVHVKVVNSKVTIDSANCSFTVQMLQPHTGHIDFGHLNCSLSEYITVDEITNSYCDHDGRDLKKIKDRFKGQSSKTSKTNYLAESSSRQLPDYCEEDVENDFSGKLPVRRLMATADHLTEIAQTKGIDTTDTSHTIASTTCRPYTWGKSCENSCGNCQDQCTLDEGVCEICNPGFRNPQGACTEPCDINEYGINCSLSCLTKCGSDCDERIHGTCPVLDFMYHLFVFVALGCCLVAGMTTFIFSKRKIFHHIRTFHTRPPQAEELHEWEEPVMIPVPVGQTFQESFTSLGSYI